MKIEEIKNLQNTNLLRDSIINQIKEILPKYNEECEIISTRNSLFLNSIIINDIYDFLEESELKFSPLVERTIVIDNTGIEIIINEDGFSIKRNDIYKSFIISVDKKYQPDGYIYKCIKLKENLIPTSSEEKFINKLILLNERELDEVLEILKNAINDVKNAPNQLSSFGDKDNSIEHEYYAYENEDTRYKNIKEIIEKEI